MKNLTAIIRVSGKFSDFESNFNVRSFLYSKYYKNDVNYLIVDYCENNGDSKEIKLFCQKNGWEYIKCPDANSLNSSRAINTGIKYASTEFIVIEDIDLIHTKNFYKDIQNKLIAKWDEKPFNFYTFPVAYLDFETSDGIVNNPNKLSDENFIDRLDDEIELYQTSSVVNFVPQSSLILLRKDLAEFVGLFDENFVGWGGEDRDFIFRLLSVNNHIQLNSDFHYTSTENGFRLSKFVGWRALWALIGDYVYKKGFTSFHLYHEERKWKQNSAKGLARNTIKLAIEKAKKIGSNYFIYLTPNCNNQNNIFVYGRNPHIHNYDLFHALGGYFLLEETWSLDTILSKLNKSSKIIMWNPYGSSKRLWLYNKLKNAGYLVYLAERGALPDSIVFDPSGLVIFSDQYDRKLWDHNLSIQNKNSAITYLNNLKTSGTTLEKQDENSSIELFKLNLNPRKYKKIILICLQLETDTVTNQNIEGYISYPNYIDQLRNLIKNSPSEYCYIVKKHPLTNTPMKWDGAIIGDGYHIHDLIKLSDCIITYNSGTGIIARAFGKPVITFGPTSYTDPYFTYQANTADDVIEILNVGLKEISEEKILRYFSYLVNEFYSFAKFNQIKERKIENATLRYPSQISYYKINLPFATKNKFCDKYLIPSQGNIFKRFFWTFNLNEIKTKTTNKNTNETKEKTINKAMQKSPSKNMETSSISKKQMQNRKQRLFNKLKNDPYNYFNDSQFPIRWMRFFFSKK